MKNKILILILLSVFPISNLTAALLGTTEPIDLVANPVLSKSGSLNELAASSIDYSNLLPIDGVSFRLECQSKPYVQIRFKNQLNIWSDWQNARIFAEPLSDRWIASYVGDLAKFSNKFDFIIKVDGNFDVRLLEQGIFPTDTEIYPQVIGKPITFPTDIPKPTIITRQEWGARPPVDNYTATRDYTKLTIHHAAGWQATNLNDGKAAVKAIQDFHIDGRGWSDIAYHFLIDDAGNIYQGRPETVQGAHTLNNNSGNIGICFLGCYDPPYEQTAGISCHQRLTEESRAAVVHLFAWIIETYDYPNADLLKGHRDYYDYARTSCPGQNIHDLLPEMRNEINEFVKFGGPPFDYSIIDNYPNPFFDITNIEYTLPVESKVTVTIYNIKGEKVITLLENQIQSKGMHSLPWSGYDARNNLSHTGVYFYKINTNQNISAQLDKNYSDTGKMLFLK